MNKQPEQEKLAKRIAELEALLEENNRLVKLIAKIHVDKEQALRDLAESILSKGKWHEEAIKDVNDCLNQALGELPTANDKENP